MPRFMVFVCLCTFLAACSNAPRENPNLNLPAAPPPGEPADLVGLQPSALRVAFGAPAFVRKDGPAEMWRYDSPGCKAFFFFYSNGSALTIKHVETLPRGSEMAADANCLAAIRQHAASPVS